MARENQQNSAAIADDEDATLVQPLFTEEAAETARPVVPLAAAPASVGVGPRPAWTFAAPARRSWLPALILISALAGGALGGALALRFYQKRQGAAAVPAATNAAPSEQPPAQARQGAVAPSHAPAEVEKQPQETEAASAQQPAAPQVVEPQPAGGDVAEKRSEPAEEASSQPSREPVSEERRAEEPRARRSSEDWRDPAVYDAGEAGPRKRGKRGEEDRDEDRQPRLVDRIIYPQQSQRRRRQARPAEEAPSRDRVRAIFEGQPPR